METKIRPLLDHPLVEFIGEIGEKEKPEFLGKAFALLFPIDWVEPFGLVMLEAMACGTPTIAFRRGSVPEIIDTGLTGFIVEDVEESLDALDKVQHFDRARCRQLFEERFSVNRMAANYIKTYERLIDTKRRSRPQLIQAKEKTRQKAMPTGEAASRVIPFRTEPESTS
jgi:glycosyltransferase involved in cell wall biosynthesis